MRALVSIICLTVGCTFLVNLGFWQLSRGEEKEEIAALYDQRNRAVFDHLEEMRNFMKPDILVWRKFELSGRFFEKSFLLDNRVKNSKAGYDIFTPFQVTNGPLVLVSSGWIAQEGSRNQLPVLPAFKKKTAIKGTLTPAPFSGLNFMSSVLNFEEVEKGRFRIQRIDLEALSTRLGVELYPLVMYIENPIEGLIENTPDHNLYQPHKHYAYALQWFSMAFVLACIGFYNLLRFRRRG